MKKKITPQKQNKQVDFFIMCAARVSPEQRIRMLEFMLAHADFARGRVTGPDAARTKKVLQQELSVVLNSLGSGATKRPKKWWKCWQDWISDTKAKSIKIKKFRGGTGGGPAPAPLSQTETTLLEFCGIEMVEGLEVPDPLEESAPPLLTVASSSPAEDVVGDTEVDNIRDDPLRGSMEEWRRNGAAMERQAAAMERQAAAMERQAAAIESLAAGLNRLADNMASQTPYALLAIAAAIEKH